MNIITREFFDAQKIQFGTLWILLLFRMTPLPYFVLECFGTQEFQCMTMYTLLYDEYTLIYIYILWYALSSLNFYGNQSGVGGTTANPGALCKSTRGRDCFCGKIFTKTSRFYLWERELLGARQACFYTDEKDGIIVGYSSSKSMDSIFSS